MCVRRGLARASLDEIAEAAGFTKGAVYSNFPGKRSLYLAVLLRRAVPGLRLGGLSPRRVERVDTGVATALVAFARAHGDMGGQIFALMVMVVAACEVAVGLGLVVAIYRRRLPIDVDELRELQG